MTTLAAFKTITDLYIGDDGVVTQTWSVQVDQYSAGLSDPTAYDFTGPLLSQDIAVGALRDYTDVMVPHPLVPSAAGATENSSKFKIYDGTTLIAWADENGLLHDAASGTYLDGATTNTVDFAGGVINFDLDSGFTPAGTINAKYRSYSTVLLLAYADNPGAWADSYDVQVRAANPSTQEFKILATENRGSLPSVTVENFLVSRAHKLDGFGRQEYLEDRINDHSYYLRVMDNPYLEETDVLPLTFASYIPTETIAQNEVSAYTVFAMTGGSKGLAPSVADYVTQLEMFNNKEDIAIDIVIDSVGHQTYQNAIANLCDRNLGGRGDCYGVLYVPFSVEESTNYINDAINYRKYTLPLASSYVGLYFGHVKILDTYNNREIYIPPSGFVAAAFSFTADQYEPWFPAAGWSRGQLGVLDLYRKLTLGQRDSLYDSDVNAMKFKPGRGIAIWGQKTMYGTASALDRANVRWLLIVVENAIEAFLENYEFEINDAYTRSLIAASVTAYLNGIQVRRGLYAFNVVCDETNNPASVIADYKLYIDYYLQPVLAAEYIYARAVITRTGVEFSSVSLV
jgi:hypothetical protein